MLLRTTLLLLLFINAAWAADVTNPLVNDPVPDAMFPPSIEELTLEVDGKRLSGLLYLANGIGPHPTVVLLHGFPGNEKNLDIAQAVRRAGFNVMFFHYRGAWGSEGDYCLGQLVEDVQGALNFLRNNATRYRVNTRKLSLLGHSMGGFAALAAGSKDNGLTCVGAMSPANLGLMAEGIRVGEPGALQFLDYADGLFMLKNFDGAHMRKDLLSVSAMSLDTRHFGAGLRGKSVFMVVGEHDVVTPAQSMFDPTVAAYARDPGIELSHFKIPGDHSYSWSRIQLTELVLDWLQTDCR
jgi:pimeloyl-ACP methyl ester carboxylesterase